MGVPEEIGSNVPNLTNDVLRVPKCVTRWGSIPNQFLMGSKMKSWTIHVQMGVLEAKESDVPKFIKDIPNFVKDVPWVPKCIRRWESALNHFLMGC